MPSDVYLAPVQLLHPYGHLFDSVFGCVLTPFSHQFRRNKHANGCIHATTSNPPPPTVKVEGGSTLTMPYFHEVSNKFVFNPCIHIFGLLNSVHCLEKAQHFNTVKGKNMPTNASTIDTQQRNRMY